MNSPVGIGFDDLGTLVRARRTSMLVDKERDVPIEVVEQLCELAQWAPNHKRTWPWRFALFTGESRRRLGEAIAEVLAANGEEAFKVDKARTKYLRTPTTLVLGSAPGDSPTRTAENRDAAAAGLQNLLLGATALGLATYWGSCPKGANDAVAELCKFEPGTFIVSLTYLGWATSHVEAPNRPAVEINVIN
jgi:nitroreductase